MKFLALSLLCLPTLGFGADLTIYKCTYRIQKSDGKPAFEMSGNIVADDATAPGDPYRTTYLTLAPNQLSGNALLEARILITTEGYNPITLHKPGQSAVDVAYSELKADGGELGYVGETGTSYSVECRRR
jgi:hypothetical protein